MHASLLQRPKQMQNMMLQDFFPLSCKKVQIGVRLIKPKKDYNDYLKITLKIRQPRERE
jgi:hypothetical protein